MRMLEIMRRRKMVIIVLKKDNVTISLLENMINCLESLQEQYPKNINLDKEEK